MCILYQKHTSQLSQISNSLSFLTYEIKGLMYITDTLSSFENYNPAKWGENKEQHEHYCFILQTTL